MVIRVATLDDLPRIMELGASLHLESPRWSRLSFNQDKASTFISNLITEPHGVVFVATQDGIVIGGIAGLAVPHWSSDDIIAHEVSFFMAKSVRGRFVPVRLISALNAWAQMRKAVWLDAGTSTGLAPERTAALYEALDFERTSIGLEFYYGN